MFVIRELLNRNDLIEWAITEGFREIVPATALHVTVGKFHETNVWRQLVPAADDLTIRAEPTKSYTELWRHRRAGLWFRQAFTPSR